MAVAFDTFNQYASVAFPGQINDLSMADLETYVPELTAVPFGVGVVPSVAAKSCRLPAATAAYFIGISVMTPVSVAAAYPGAGNPVGADPIGRESTILTHGRIWVTTVGGATKFSQVYMVPTTGALTNAATTGNHLLPGVIFLTDAAAGGLALVQVRGKALTTIV